MDDGISIRDRILKRLQAQRKQEDDRLAKQIRREVEEEKDLALLRMLKDSIFSLYKCCFFHNVPEDVQKTVDQAQPKDMPALRAISDYLSGHKGNEEEFKRFAKTSLA